jgi:tetratricopeptide (TPR) repeat protein
VTDDSFQQAQAFFNAGNYRRCQELVEQALSDAPDDVRLLRLAGKCSLELNTGQSAGYFRRVVNQTPDDIEAWHSLGDALMDEGDLAEAAAAFRQAIRLRPHDALALTDLGHLMFAMGEKDEAIACLTQAAQYSPGNLSTLRSLLDMHRRAGNPEKALDVAREITRFQPNDVLGTLDVADLSRAVGQLDEAVAAYHTLRSIDEQAEHEVYAYHGMIQCEMQRDRWRRVLDIAIDATKVDRSGLTTDLLAYAVVQVFGASDRPSPDRAEVEAWLAAELAEHRRLHTEDLAV